MIARISCRITRYLVGVFLLTAISAGASADERILRFVSHIDVQTDGDLIVTETITVRAEGDQIKRGIFRDIPLVFETDDGRRRQAGFDLLGVEQDGREAAYHTVRNRGGIRIYIGDEDVFIPHGKHVYTIKYRTSRQIRFFSSHDEVYWNVTGNEWVFPIDAVLAEVVFPPGAKPEHYDAFTGFYGSEGRNFEVEEQEAGSSLFFRTTHTLAPYAGLSVVVALPKGTISPPTEAQKTKYFLMDYRAELLGGFGIFLVLAYYLLTWFLIGRDPAKGVIFPRFKAPDGISPALANYIVNRGFGDGGWTALSAACLNLAVKGRIILEDPGEAVTLTPQVSGSSKRGWNALLPKGEAAVNRWLSNRGSPLTISKDNGTSVKTLGSKFRSAIEDESRNEYFKSNKLFLIPGVLLSILTIIALIAFGNASDDEIAFLVAAVMFGTFIAISIVNLFKKARHFGSVGRRVSMVVSIFAVIVAIGIFAPVFSLDSLENLPRLPILAVVLFVTNILFFFLMGAPTALGREKLDGIEGLKLYLSVAEAERMNMAGHPEMSPSHFETLLPYAVALGVEKPWSDAFQSWLTSAAGAAASASYAPTWYSGRVFDSHNVSRSMNSVTSAMAGSFTTSLPAPKSSSSGFSSGGGFSGGGGGGGGGGGW